MRSVAFESFITPATATLTFRPAMQRDNPEIARLHDAVWHEGHRGLSPAQISGSPEDERSLWPQDGSGIRMVAERGGELVGFAIGGPARDPLLKADTEIQALCIRPGLRFRGIGAALIAALAQRLAMVLGARQAGVWISAVNVAAVAFARALGAVVERKTAVSHAIASGNLLTGSPRLALVWHDIDTLAFHAKRLSAQS